jgi:hypothetical protein
VRTAGKNIIYSVLFLVFPSVLMAQSETSSVSASIYDVAFDSARAKLNPQQLAVYTGREYYDYYLKQAPKYGGYWLSATGNRPGEHPFYQGGEFKSEMIIFEGVTYPAINLAFDICRSEVVVLSPKQKLIVIPEGKVDKFTYAGHTFELLSGITDLKSDFYEVLYRSDADAVMFCVKRRKNQTELWHTIDDYYVIRNNQAYPVSAIGTQSIGAKNMMLKIFEDKKVEIKAYMRQNRLKFGKTTKETSMTKVVEYYASLKTH